jgi:hypothetical protein
LSIKTPKNDLNKATPLIIFFETMLKMKKRKENPYKLTPKLKEHCGCNWLCACEKHSAEYSRIDEELREKGQ